MERGSSFEILRARVLYGISATKKAAYRKIKIKPTYQPGTYGFVTKPIPIIEVEKSALLHGNYVDIDKLNEFVENNF